MHSAKPLLKSYTKAGKIYVLRNKPAEFPSHAIQYFYNHVLVCVWRFGHSAASLLGSRLRWKPNKVGQPRVRASPAVSKSKSQPGNKAPACIVWVNSASAWQPWYCISSSESAHRAKRELHTEQKGSRAADVLACRLQNGGDSGVGKKALFINYGLEIAHTANFVHATWGWGKVPQTKLCLLIYLFFFVALLLSGLV